jgi:peptide-methionine (R)-S-oxide reductase
MIHQINIQLSEAQKQVLLQKENEAPFTGEFYLDMSDGIYKCANCDNPLFRSSEQYDAGCGWPSFTEPITPKAVGYRTDNSFGMTRTEVICGKCGAHLGHVFEDGPGHSGQRYCINSLALNKVKK